MRCGMEARQDQLETNSLDALSRLDQSMKLDTLRKASLIILRITKNKLNKTFTLDEIVRKIFTDKNYPDNNSGKRIWSFENTNGCFSPSAKHKLYIYLTQDNDGKAIKLDVIDKDTTLRRAWDLFVAHKDILHSNRNSYLDQMSIADYIKCAKEANKEKEEKKKKEESKKKQNADLAPTQTNTSSQKQEVNTVSQQILSNLFESYGLRVDVSNSTFTIFNNKRPFKNPESQIIKFQKTKESEPVPQMPVQQASVVGVAGGEELESLITSFLDVENPEPQTIAVQKSNESEPASQLPAQQESVEEVIGVDKELEFSIPELLDDVENQLTRNMF